MSQYNEIILLNSDQISNISALSQKLFEESVSSSKTLTSNNNHQLCQEIKRIKNVRVGKKGDFKLMQQNILNITDNVLRNCRPKKLKALRSMKASSSQLASLKKTKNIKKVIKQNQKTTKIHKKKYSISNETTIQVDNYVKKQLLPIQSDKKNNSVFHEFRYKGMSQNQNIIHSGIGHCTLIFPQHITEGAYYIQLRILQTVDNQRGQLYENKSQIRIGVCRPEHKLDMPLGIKDSIGFHFSKKSIVTEGKIENLTYVNSQVAQKPIKNGDIVGFLLSFSQPYKRPNKNQNWQDSHLTFSLNGQILGSYTGIKQMFYHPAISMYNGASAEIRTRAEQMDYLPQSCLPYSKIKQYINIYH